jgi:hypothetical protein
MNLMLERLEYSAPLACRIMSQVVTTFRAPTSRPVQSLIVALGVLVLASSQLGCTTESPAQRADPLTAPATTETMTRGDVEQELDRLEHTLSETQEKDTSAAPQHAPPLPPRARGERKNTVPSPSIRAHQQS